jgi:hypothetical protein
MISSTDLSAGQFCSGYIVNRHVSLYKSGYFRASYRGIMPLSETSTSVPFTENGSHIYHIPPWAFVNYGNSLCRVRIDAALPVGSSTLSTTSLELTSPGKSLCVLCQLVGSVPD